MSRAHETNPTRRAVLGNVAAAVVIAPAIPFTALALAEPVDPIFALIEAHRTALRSYGEAFHRNQDIEEAFLDAKPFPRDVWEQDPRFVESMRECDDWYRRQAEAAATIGKTVPITAAGAVALLAYSAEYVGCGLEPEIIDWPTADVFRNTAAALTG